ncbi:hypothetical protein HpDR150_15010 [Helicobacter pylori]
MLKGVKVVTSGPSVKDRTSTPKEPKEKEDKFKLSFGFKDKDMTSFEVMAEDYTLIDRKSRLGALITPMFFEGKGNQVTAIILTALANAKGLNRHSDAEWSAMLDNRNTDECDYDTFDYMDRVGTTLFCGVIKSYAEGREEFNEDFNDFSPSGFWARTLPKNKNEALFIAQLLCDGGINRYNLSCAGLTENLLKDVIPHIGLETDDEYLKELDADDELAKNSDEWVVSLKN